MGIAVVAALLSLTSACSGTSGATPTPSASVSASPSVSATPSPSETITPAPVVNNLDGIKVAGTFNTDATVTITSPMAIDQTRSTVLTAGTGAAVSDTAIVKVQYTGVNGRTMQVFDSSFGKSGAIELSLAGGVVAGFTKGLAGKNIGDRVLIAMPGADGYDSAQTLPTGIAKGDTLIFVVDIIDAQLSGPSGTPVAIPAGLPQVTDVNGKPSITIPAGATPPTTLVSQVVIQGSGAKVAAANYVLTHYVGYSWKTGKVVDDHFAEVDIDKLANSIDGFKTGLVDKAVGSRVLLVIPPADSWPNGNTNPVVEKGDTVVYVVDLLYTSAGQ